MELALYHDPLGYYNQDRILIGKGGDFVTSPHTGPLFGALIANQIEEFASILKVDDFTITEMGAGSGYLAKDILRHLKKHRKHLFSRLRYVIIEPADNWKNYQEANLEEFIHKVSWVKCLDDINGLSGCFISNELLDAFPVHLIQKEGGLFKELFVTIDSNEMFTYVPVEIQDESLKGYINILPGDLPEGYRSEVSLDMKRWIEEVASRIKSGFVLTIDYGHVRTEYFNPSRNRGTLLCYKDHMVDENPLDNPGDKDITAHVNFSDLKDWADGCGLMTIGFTEQWAFLASLDFQRTFEEYFGKIEPFSPLLASVKMLIMPQGMGQTHKVLILGKNVPTDLRLKGFSLKDISHRL